MITGRQMRSDFAVFILSHGRADNVKTIKALHKSCYDGKIYIIIDDEDESEEEYRKNYGDMVIQFCKKDAAKNTDAGINTGQRNAVVFARNECWNIAKKLGISWFLVLDDDYSEFGYRFNDLLEYKAKKILGIEPIIDELIEYMENTPFVTIAIGQTGDFIGGKTNKRFAGKITATRKAMNWFLCNVNREFSFPGMINEDATAYTYWQLRGVPFLTTFQIILQQAPTQQQKGGLTDIYLDSGTYVKSFYSVMYSPSCVSIREMGNKEKRIHHQIHWNNCAPKIIPEEHKKRQ